MNTEYRVNTKTGETYHRSFLTHSAIHPEDVAAGWIAVSKAKFADLDAKHAAAQLRKWLKPGDTVWTVLRHRSASGMSRSIQLVMPYRETQRGPFLKMVNGSAVYGPGKAVTRIRDLSYIAARAMRDATDDKHGGIKVSGCGMDMGFHLVYNLGRTLWPKGTKKPHGTRNGEPDSDGGYALSQTWL